MKKVLDTDINGNELTYISGQRKRITLKLKGHTREIAEIKGTKDNFHLLIRRNRTKHLFKKNRSYGFNDILLKKAIDAGINVVRLVDDKGAYMFPCRLILDEGKYLFFAQQGFERQLFLEIDRIEEFKVVEETQKDIF